MTLSVRVKTDMGIDTNMGVELLLVVDSVMDLPTIMVIDMGADPDVGAKSVLGVDAIVDLSITDDMVYLSVSFVCMYLQYLNY